MPRLVLINRSPTLVDYPAPKFCSLDGREGVFAVIRQIDAVERAGLTMSMTEKNHSAENALAERVNGILKQEYWLDSNFENGRQARQATMHGICMYNTRRPHTALKLATPEQVHGMGNDL